MKYTAITRNNQYFELVDERQQVAGQIDYSSWIPSKAEMTTGDGAVYKASLAGLWGKIAVTKNDRPFAEVKADWGIGLHLSFDSGPAYHIKRKSFWGAGYMVTDNSEQAIAEIQAEFKWRKMSTDYIVDIPYDLPDRMINTIMPLLLVYCARYIRMRSS